VIFTIEDDDYVLLPSGFEVLEASTTEGVIRFGLVLRIAPSASGWCASWRYNTSLFDAKGIERMQSDFATLLEQIAAHPTARINELELSEKWRPSNIAGREQATVHAARIHFSAPKRAQAAHDNN
jgi:non-ribosomal peptide synthetase component F